MSAPSLESGPPAPTAVGRAVQAAERWAAVVIIVTMAILPSLEVFARKLFHAGIPGQQLFVQHLTLWIGFLGALLATRAGKHLSLATGDLLPEGKLRLISGVYVNSLAAGITAVLAYASYELVQADSARQTFLPGGIPEYWSEGIMPVALGLIALRFVWRAGTWSGRTIALAVALGICAGAPGVAPEKMLWPGIIAILGGVALGMPVFVAMAGVAMLLFRVEGSGIAAVPAETYRLVQNPTLPAIPLLTVAGYILAEGGASKRLVRLARALVGWMPGGMALMVCFICAGFTTFTGGSGVTILALGGLMLPMLLQAGYPEGFSLGLVSSSGSLGLLFPPSIPVILYAVVVGASMEDLYIAGFLPSLLLVALVAAYGIFTGLRVHAPRTAFSAGEAASSLWECKWELAIPVIVIASIFTGYATMVESAALAVVLAAVSQSAIFRDLHPTKQLPNVIEHATTLVGAVVILLGVAMGLASYIVDEQVAELVLTWMKGHIHSQVVFLLVLNGALLVLGSILEIYSAIVILAPLLKPMAEAYGIDPLHLGVVFLANLELGFLFPPMGLNLILSAARFNKRLPYLYRVCLPFLAIMALGVLLVTYVPAMTTGFLHLVRGR